MQPDELEQILVVDDQQHVRMLLGKFLASQYPKANVRFYDPVADGRPGPSFDWDEFDLVILDINLGPGQNGLDWLVEARDRGHSPATMVLTGEGDEETAVRAFDVGALGYLSKLKLTKGRLVAAIERTLEKSDRESRRSNTGELRRSILNKSLFYGRLSRDLRALPEGRYAALYLIGIDDFSALLNAVGIIESDRIAGDLTDCVCKALAGPSDTPGVTRISDGIIAALVLGIADAARCQTDAEAIFEAVDALGLRNGSRALSVSIGAVFIAGGDAPSGEEMLQQADVACRLAAKQKNGHTFHLEASGGGAVERPDAPRLFDVGEAIKQNRLQCRFQPLALMSDRLGVGDAQFYQLRVQIIAPNGDAHPPPKVVNSVELMRMLDRWVLREALATLHAHLAREPDGPGNRLSVLLSQPTLYDAKLAEWLEGLIRHLAAPDIGSALILEVSARDVMRDYGAARQRLEDLRARLGCELALVDLSLPDLLARCTEAVRFDYIRLPASDMPDVAGAEGSRFETDVTYAREHGAAVVVEKVESATQLSLAVRFGIDFVQGFFLREAQDEIVDDTLVDRFVVG